MRFAVAVLALTLSLFVVLRPGGDESAHALTVREWSGKAQTPNWSNPGNWTGGALPVNGDFIVFGPILPGLTTTLVNDMQGLSVARITVKDRGYSISGNSLQVTEIVALDNAIGVVLSLPISGAGEVIVDQGSVLKLSGNNTFTGRVDVRGILEVGSNTALGSPAGITRTTPPGHIQINLDVTSIGQETLRIHGDGKGINGGFYGALAIFPDSFTIANLEIVDTAVVSATGVVNLPNGFQTYLNGGDIELRNGTFVFSGPSDDGSIHLAYGASAVWNSTALVMAISAEPWVPPPGDPPPPANESRLWGGGTTGEAFIRTGEISPRSGNSPARLTLIDDFILSDAAFSALLNGVAPGTGYSQLSVGDLLTLGPNATLELQLNFNPAPGQSFRIIDVVRNNVTVQGTFAGLPEGAKFSLGGKLWTITYKGGTGNDVEISTAPAAPADPRPFKRFVPMVARNP